MSVGKLIGPVTVQSVHSYTKDTIVQSTSVWNPFFSCLTAESSSFIYKGLHGFLLTLEN